MSAPGSHVAGKLVKKALELRRHSYRSGSWSVVTDLHEAGGTYSNLVAHMRLLHYTTDMLAWTYKPSTGEIRITGTWTGHGSTSDQTGVNSALMALGSPLRFSRVGVRKKVMGKYRDVYPERARINRRRR